jgi:hypothetical protein
MTKYKLLKDLPGYKPDNHLFYKNNSYWYCSIHPDTVPDDYMVRILEEYFQDPDWFQPIEDKPEQTKKLHWIKLEREDSEFNELSNKYVEVLTDVPTKWTEEQGVKVAEAVQCVLGYIQTPDNLTILTLGYIGNRINEARKAVQGDSND